MENIILKTANRIKTFNEIQTYLIVSAYTLLAAAFVLMFGDMLIDILVERGIDVNSYPVLQAFVEFDSLVIDYYNFMFFNNLEELWPEGTSFVYNTIFGNESYTKHGFVVFNVVLSAYIGNYALCYFYKKIINRTYRKEAKE